MRRLRSKIFALTIGCLFCTALLLSAHEVLTLKREIEYEFDLRSLVLVRTFMHLASEGLSGRHPGLIGDFLNALATDPDAVEAYVLDRAGRTLASRVREGGAGAAFVPEPGQLRRALEGFTPQSCEVRSGGHRYKLTYQRVWAETPRGIVTLGVCVIKLDLYRLDRKVARVIVLDLLMISGFSLLVLVLSYLFSIELTRPLEQLKAAADSIRGGDFRVSLPASRGDEIGVLSDSFEAMILGIKEREFMRDTFGKYVSPEVLGLILRGEVRFGGERRQISVLIADIRDFTLISENRPPEEVMALLNGHFGRMVKVIQAHGGVVDKFIGDAMLIVFGAPIPVEDHAARAARAALAMHEELARMNAESRERGTEELAMGIAINTGVAVAGNLGSPERMAYTVIGDTVNLAARMEELNKRFKTDIIVSGSTRRALEGGQFHFTSLGTVEVRGRKAAVELFELLGRSP